MTLSLKAGIASAALAIAAGMVGPASAADLGGSPGSIKDNYAPAPMMSRGPSGPCYFRADAGYSHSNSPEVRWPVSRETFTTNLYGDGTPANPYLTEELYGTTYLTDKVGDVKIEKTWLAEVGAGCSWGGSRGVRVEAMFGFRGTRDVDGNPGIYSREYFVNDYRTVAPVPAPVPQAPVVTDDPLHTSLRTHTLMVNLYKDLGNYGGITPYVGAGIGAAYHRLGDVYFTNNDFLTNRIKGDNDLSFAWSLMAGIGYQISDRAILDIGYRYIDMGKASSDRIDSAGNVNPRVLLDDITAHEIKVGLRYHLGSGGETVAYAPMK